MTKREEGWQLKSAYIYIYTMGKPREWQLICPGVAKGDFQQDDIRPRSWEGEGICHMGKSGWAPCRATACTVKVKSAQGTGRSSMYLDHNALGGKERFKRFGWVDS